MTVYTNQCGNTVPLEWGRQRALRTQSSRVIPSCCLLCGLLCANNSLERLPQCRRWTMTKAKAANLEPKWQDLSPGLGPLFKWDGFHGGADTSTALSALFSVSVPLLESLPHHCWKRNSLHEQPFWLQGHHFIQGDWSNADHRHCRQAVCSPGMHRS